MVEDSGTGGDGAAHGIWRIVPGSGDGELAAVEGEGSWEWKQGTETVACTLSCRL